MNYRVELDKMLDEVIKSFGHESKEALRLAVVIDKIYEDCNEAKFNRVVKIYNSIMKRS